jgi:hypothetical protein
VRTVLPGKDAVPVKDAAHATTRDAVRARAEAAVTIAAEIAAWRARQRSILKN